MTSWSDWASRSAHHVLSTRQETRRTVAHAFVAEGPREDHEFTAEAAAARQPGRQLVEAFERCRVKFLARLARPASRGGFGWRLTYEQERLFEAMRDVLFLKMFGSIEAYLSNLAFLGRYTPRPEELSTKVGVILPRRAGKSFVEQVVTCITLLVFAPVGGNIFCYNMTGAAAQRWLGDAEVLLRLMETDDEFGFVVVHQALGKSLRFRRHGVRNASVSIQVFGNATNARNAQNLRGTGGRALFVILDEGLFFCTEAYEVILPTVANGAGMILTSSKPAVNSAAVNLLDAKTKDGKNVLRVLNWRPTCVMCAEQEKRTQVEVQCKHVSSRPMHFRTRTDEEMLEAMMLSFGESVYGREMLNESAADHSAPFFHANAIAAAFPCLESLARTARRRIAAFNGTVTHMITSIDVGSRHGLSDTAMVTAAFVRHLTPSGQPRALTLPDEAQAEKQFIVVRVVHHHHPTNNAASR